MTFCCFDVPSKYSPVDTGATYNGGNGYPGNRPYNNYPGNNQQQPMFMPTGGNALQAYNPNFPSGGGGSGAQMIQVVVPDGVYPGQVVHVTVPDGSGNIVAATVPPGLSPGATFMVECPAAPVTSSNLPVATPVSYPSQPQQPQIVANATPYYRPPQNQQPIQGQPYNYGQQNYNNNGRNGYHYNQPQSTSNGGGMAPVIAGVAGAAMLAGAAGLAYEHFHHDQDNNEYVDNTYDGGYDGGDFGGDY